MLCYAMLCRTCWCYSILHVADLLYVCDGCDVPHLCRLDDFDNSCAAYNKALELTGGDDSDYLTYLNYAITLYNNDELERSRELYDRFSAAFGALAESDDIDSEIFSQSMMLKQALSQ
jgi:Bardet-Biedl syndrome 4 protein